MSNAGWERIAVVGVTGSGKTTLAQTLADLLHAPHIELDSLYWGPGWTETPREVLRERVAQALDASAWVVDGNYGQARDIVWRRAAALVWLDDTWPVIFWRLASRTIQRIAARTELWNGNRENWREALFSVDRGLLRSTARQPKKTRKISCRMHSGFAVNRRSGAV
jgi:adenylate kinase family enzyme